MPALQRLPVHVGAAASGLGRGRLGVQPGRQTGEPAWVRQTRDTCDASDVAFYFEQRSGPTPTRGMPPGRAPSRPTPPALRCTCGVASNEGGAAKWLQKRSCARRGASRCDVKRGLDLGLWQDV
jgi:hypothetical protein